MKLLHSGEKKNQMKILHLTEPDPVPLTVEEVVCSHGRKCVLEYLLFRYSQFYLYENRGFIIPAPRKISVRSGIWCTSGIARENLVVGNRPLPEHPV